MFFFLEKIFLMKFQRPGVAPVSQKFSRQNSPSAPLDLQELEHTDDVKTSEVRKNSVLIHSKSETSAKISNNNSAQMHRSSFHLNRVISSPLMRKPEKESNNNNSINRPQQNHSDFFDYTQPPSINAPIIAIQPPIVVELGQPTSDAVSGFDPSQMYVGSPYYEHIMRNLEGKVIPDLERKGKNFVDEEKLTVLSEAVKIFSENSF
jgi:hypothetical protein